MASFTAPTLIIPRVWILCLLFYTFSKIEYIHRKVHKLQVYSDEFSQTVSHTTTATTTRLRNDITSF